jgi:MoaA/NifB/PqqE/SkfB family radical SAM enzyme
MSTADARSAPPRASYGWEEISRDAKRALIESIASGVPTPGPLHAELDLTDRCNVACYFCNQQDLRTKDQICYERAVALIDELARTGLRSVRLSGGGDPLFHREIIPILDHLTARGIAIDNVTTNGVALDGEVARRLVAARAREVVVSLNTVDPADYQRMMKVRGDRFDAVAENIRRLVELRGASSHPSVVVQFLLDRGNFLRIEQMYDLASSLGADRVAFNAVLQIYGSPLGAETLLDQNDAAAARPLLEAVLARDRERGLLQIDFPIPGWNEVIAAAKEAAGYVTRNDYPTAPSFRDANGGCFFAWYSAAVTGNGDVRPCCLMLSPGTTPLGNVNDTSFGAIWSGSGYSELRDEMRDVLIAKSDLLYRPSRFRRLERRCVEPNACWLKNMFFRGDDEFYRDLGIALDAARERDARWLGSPRQRRRKLETFLHTTLRGRKIYEALRTATLPLRRRLEQRLGVRLTGLAQGR